MVVSSRAKLELKNNFLVVRSDTVRRVHIDEISVLIIENTGTAVTVSLLETLWSKKVCVIFCDRKRNPGAQIIPYHNSHDCSARVYEQINWNPDFSIILWSEIIRQKIKNQAHVLKSLNKIEAMSLLLSYADAVEPGDITNREGHAAKVYFNSLFGSSFTRDDICFENSALNYGYSILMSSVSREIAANGYLTQLGIFHGNVYNPFNLACDLMEPYRPVIDSVVVNMHKSESQELEHSAKLNLVECLNKTVIISGTHQTLLNSLSIYVRSMLEALDKRDISLARFITNEF